MSSRLTLIALRSDRTSASWSRAARAASSRWDCVVSTADTRVSRAVTLAVFARLASLVARPPAPMAPRERDRMAPMMAPIPLANEKPLSKVRSLPSDDAGAPPVSLSSLLMVTHPQGQVMTCQRAPSL